MPASPCAPASPRSPLSPLETTACEPSLKWITVLPSASLSVPVTVNGVAEVPLPAAPVSPLSPLSPFAPFGIVNSFPSEKETLVSPFGCVSMLLIVIESPLAPASPGLP